jgi:hypothetical protein
MAFGKTVQVRVLDKDRYGRLVGEVTVGDQSVNHALVAAGWAWWFRKYAPDDEQLAKAEAEARAEKRGLCADPQPMPPWEWRRIQREKQASDRQPVKDDYWLNTSSGVRHNRSCEWFGKTAHGRVCGPDEGKACGMCGG